MSGEILFRRAKFGGFNREDVMQYISEMAEDNGDREKAERDLSKAKAELLSVRESINSKDEMIEQLKAEIEALKADAEIKSSKIKTLEAEIDVKNTRLMSMQLEVEAKRNAPVEEKKEESTLSAERLMQDSMAYAERYIQSAGMVAGNIKKDTLERLNEAGRQLTKMRETASQLSISSEKFNLLLEKLSEDVSETAKGFEQNEKQSEDQE